MLEHFACVKTLPKEEFDPHIKGNGGCVLEVGDILAVVLVEE